MTTLLLALGKAGVAAEIVSPTTPLAKKEMQKSVNGIIHELENSYLFPDNAASAIESLRHKLIIGEFNQLNDSERFKQRLDALLVQATGDSNFELIRKLSSVNATSQQVEHHKRHLLRLVHSAVHEGNVGYLQLKGDFRQEGVETQIIDGFNHVKDVDALVIDVREADNGSLALTQLMLSYFLAPNTQISEIHFEQGKSIQPLITLANSNHEHFKSDIPVYVLNSSFVEGAWELLSYALQSSGRGTITGKETMGIANISKLAKVSDSLYLNLTHATIKYSNEDDSWHQIGISPDYHFSDEEALEQTFSLALDQLSK